MASKLALRSPVAFTKGMKGVDFSEVVGGSFAESGGVKSGKLLFLSKLPEDRDDGALNMSVVREQVPALAYVDRAEFSRPFVHVAEKMAVYGLQMCEVKIALERRL